MRKQKNEYDWRMNFCEVDSVRSNMIEQPHVSYK
jgi:hypothetical protein